MASKDRQLSCRQVQHAHHDHRPALAAMCIKLQIEGRSDKCVVSEYHEPRLLLQGGQVQCPAPSLPQAKSTPLALVHHRASRRLHRLWFSDWCHSEWRRTLNTYNEVHSIATPIFNCQAFLMLKDTSTSEQYWSPFYTSSKKVIIHSRSYFSVAASIYAQCPLPAIRGQAKHVDQASEKCPMRVRVISAVALQHLTIISKEDLRPTALCLQHLFSRLGYCAESVLGGIECSILCKGDVDLLSIPVELLSGK